jgi:hypothetical protein
MQYKTNSLKKLKSDNNEGRTQFGKQIMISYDRKRIIGTIALEESLPYPKNLKIR